MSLSALINTGSDFITSVRQIHERAKSVECLTRTVRFVKKSISLSAELCTKVKRTASEKLTDGVIGTLNAIPGKFYERRCQATALSCAKKCLKEASKLTALIPKDTGIVESISQASATLSNASSKPYFDSWLGKNSLGSSFLSYAVDAAASAVAAKVIKTLSPSEQLAEKVFYPLICQLNRKAAEQIAQIGVEVAACATVDFAVGGLGLTGHVVQIQEATSVVSQTTSAAIIGIHAYVYGKPVWKGSKLAMQCCLKARQIKKINQALDQIDLQPLIQKIAGLDIPYIDCAAKPLVKGVLIAMIDSGLLGTLDFAALCGNKKALNAWLMRSITLLTRLI